MAPSDRQADPAEPDAEDLPGGEDDYAAILAAVMETARGRWFLAEFARRNRHADTRMLLDALARLEAAIAEQRGEAGNSPVPAPDPQPEPAGEAEPREALKPQCEALEPKPTPTPSMPPVATLPPNGRAAGIFALSFEEKLALFS